MDHVLHLHQILAIQKRNKYSDRTQKKASMNHYCMLYIRERKEQSSYLLQIRFDVKTDKTSIRMYDGITNVQLTDCFE